MTVSLPVLEDAVRLTDIGFERYVLPPPKPQSDSMKRCVTPCLLVANVSVRRWFWRPAAALVA